MRATIVDNAGRHVRNASNAVTFEVVSGPGRVVGVHSGDPQSHEPSHATDHHAAYHGLVRALVQVTSTAARADNHLLDAIDVDRAPATNRAPATDILVRATAAGLGPATISIPTSVDPADAIL